MVASRCLIIDTLQNCMLAQQAIDEDASSTKEGSDPTFNTTVNTVHSDANSDSWNPLQHSQETNFKDITRIKNDHGRHFAKESGSANKSKLELDSHSLESQRGFFDTHDQAHASMDDTKHLILITSFDDSNANFNKIGRKFSPRAESISQDEGAPLPESVYQRYISASNRSYPYSHWWSSEKQNIFDWRRQVVPPKIQRGFGRFVIPPHVPKPKDAVRPYPPFPNISYDATTHYMPHGESITHGLHPDGATYIKSCTIALSSEDDEEAEVPQKAPSMMGEIFANRITRFATIRFGPGYFPFEGDFITSAEQRETFAADFRKAVAGVETGESLEPPLSHCRVCEKSHIPWGPPHTLQQRDTCLSMLPEWFPVERYDEPWDQFYRLINEIVRIDEIEQGIIKDSTEQSKWDKEYHENTAEWRAIGRRGGWWKCRTGKGPADKHVPQQEIMCKICHQQSPKVMPKRLANATKRENAAAWIQARMEEVAKRDREVVLGRMRAEKAMAGNQ